MSRIPEYDVAIVGYGPVGAVFANLLANYGLKIAVIERAPAIYDKPRAITLDHEALRVFQACGLTDVMERELFFGLMHFFCVQILRVIGFGEGSTKPSDLYTQEI